VLHVRQLLQPISRLHDKLAGKVKDETTLGLVGSLDKIVSAMSIAGAETGDDLSAAISGRAADASHDTAEGAWHGDPRGRGLQTRAARRGIPLQ
jgi:hypothetical protein